jgi:hypothetical protein
MSSDDLDIEKHEQRAHELTMARMIARWAAVGLSVIVFGFSYSCHEVEAARGETKAYAGALAECRGQRD